MTRLRFLGALAALTLTLSACDSSEADGELAAAEANLGQWTWIDVEGSVCRDSSSTGIGVRLQEGATDLLIYMEGGGACFNGLTCATNPRTFGEAEFNATVGALGSTGLFSTAASNPVGDYNMVYVPYCTGDVHSGSSANNSLLDLTANTTIGPQQFVGHQNMQRALALLSRGLDTPDRVVLSGSSAGGLGAMFNFDATARTFGSSDLFLLNDSGPIVYADNVLSPQLAASLIAVYGADATIPTAPQLFATDGIEDIYNYYATTYSGATFGFSSYLGDDVFQGFFGFGQPDEITDAEFAAGLRDLRGQIDPAWGTYYAEGDAHTFLLVNDRYTGTSAGVAYTDWLAGILSGSPTNVDPGVAARAPLAAR